MPFVRRFARLPIGVAALTMLAFAAVASAAPSAADEKAKRIAYNQIKDHTFTGVRGDGAEVVETYCANGKYESSVTDSYGTGISKGKSWKVADATVTQVRTTPLRMPPSISGTTMRRKVCSGERPRLIEASSRDTSIWCTIALAERTANGTLRTV